jgi:hypothetical protein
MGIASQDFRDGAATGAALMERRLRHLIYWGLRIDHNTIAQLAAEINNTYGGAVTLQDDEL